MQATENNHDIDGANVEGLLERADGLCAQGKFDDAITTCQQAIKLNPDKASAYCKLGHAHQSLGHLSDALSAINTALRLAPELPDAHKTLSIVYYKQGRINDAVASCQRAIDLNPDNEVTWTIMGNLLRMQGRQEEGIEHYQRAAQINPDYFWAQNNLGVLYYEHGRLNEASDAFQKALGLEPAMPELHNNYANLLCDMGKDGDAERELREALRLNPDLAEAHNNLGNLFRLRDDLGNAEACYRQAVQLKPDYSDARISLGMLLKDTGMLDEALSHFDQVLHTEPGNIDALAGKARVYSKQGLLQQAYDLIRPLIDSDIKHSSIALLLSDICRYFDRCKDALAMCEDLLQQTISQQRRILLSFALGKLYDAQGDYDNAFKYYQQGNDLSGRHYDHHILVNLVNNLSRVFTKEFMDTAPRASIDTHRPIFIVGMPRSGTTLVEQILASHPRVHGAGELRAVTQLTEHMPGTLESKEEYPLCLPDINQGTYDILAKQYLDYLNELSSNAERITDKMPHNFLNIGLIRLLFPQAHIIHCTRDPLDVCLSCYFQYFLQSQNFAYDLANLGKHYNEYRRIMAHWQEELGIPMLEVNYEELISDQENMTRKILNYCNLEWHEQCLRFHESKRIVNTASYDQVRQPLYSKAVRRWKRYEQYIGPLKQTLDSYSD